MIPMHTVFLMMVVVFAFIGCLRGWAKELIVGFSVILALFIEHVLTGLIPPVRGIWSAMPPLSRFWIRLLVFGIIVIFGYASPTLSAHISGKAAREKLQDILLGFFLGLLNGALIVGTLWFYVDEAYYGVPPDQRTVREVVDENGRTVEEVTYLPGATGIGGIRPPEEGSTAWKVLPYLPPRMIAGPPLYLAVGLAFVFVIIVFI